MGDGAQQRVRLRCLVSGKQPRTRRGLRQLYCRGGTRVLVPVTRLILVRQPGEHSGGEHRLIKRRRIICEPCPREIDVPQEQGVSEANGPFILALIAAVVAVEGARIEVGIRLAGDV